MTINDPKVLPINKNTTLINNEISNSDFVTTINEKDLDASLFFRAQYLKQSVKEYLVFLVDPFLVIGNIIKIIICLVLLAYMGSDSVMADLVSLKKILQGLLVVAFCWQIIVSATRSMLLPIVTIATSISLDLMVAKHGLVLPCDVIALQYLFAVGVIGIVAAVFFKL